MSICKPQVKPLLKQVFACCIGLFFTAKANGQILNIDRENGQDSILKKVNGSFTFGFSSDKQRKSIVDISNTSELDIYLKKNRVFIFLSQTELTLNGKSILENNGFFQVRVRDNDTRKFYPDAFTQVQWNGVQGMERRALVGCNLRMRWMENKTSDLYTSAGIFYESEMWNPFLAAFSFSNQALTKVNRNLFRLNLAAKFALKLTDHIDFSGSTFIQPPLNQYFSSPRWFFDSNFNFEVNKHLNVVLHYDHNFDTYRPLPIDNYYYTVTTGMLIKL